MTLAKRRDIPSLLHRTWFVNPPFLSLAVRSSKNKPLKTRRSFCLTALILAFLPPLPHLDHLSLRHQSVLSLLSAARFGRPPSVSNGLSPSPVLRASRGAVGKQKATQVPPKNNDCADRLSHLAQHHTLQPQQGAIPQHLQHPHPQNALSSLSHPNSPHQNARNFSSPHTANHGLPIQHHSPYPQVGAPPNSQPEPFYSGSAYPTPVSVQYSAPGVKPSFQYLFQHACH